MTQSLILDDYWRSSAAYRVRIGLNLKGLDYRSRPVDLRAGDQHAADYRERNPQGLVPTLEADGVRLGQSLAILEWLDERFPTPPLLPGDVTSRARIRAVAQLFACDVHPLNNLRVLNALRSEFSASEDQILAWTQRWITTGFEAAEALLAETAGRFSFGDEPTLADCFLIPQSYSADRFGADLSGLPVVSRVIANGRAHPAFAAAHPDRQPGATSN
jgi:maleylpyruvate isomerase